MKFIELSREEIDQIKAYKADGQFPGHLNDKKTKKKFKERCQMFEVVDGNFYYKEESGTLLRFFAVEEQQEKLREILRIHNVAHCGRDKIEHEVRMQIYGGKRDEIMAVINSCAVCQVRRLMTTKPVITPIVHRKPRDRYLVDMVDFTTYRVDNMGFGWMMVMIDSYSKFLYAAPLMHKSGPETADAILKMFRLYGAPTILHSDNGKEFCNKHVTKMCEEFNVRIVHGRARCPWIQGQVERVNGTLKHMISSLVIGSRPQLRWIDVLDGVVYRYNNNIHSTTSAAPMKLFMRYEEKRKVADSAIEELLLYGREEDANETIINEIEISEDSSSSVDKKAHDATDKAVQRMIEKRKWANDYLEFPLGTKVFLKNEFDANRKTKKLPLNEHLDYTVYVVVEVLQHDLVSIKPIDNDDLILKNIKTSRLRKVIELDVVE